MGSSLAASLEPDQFTFPVDAKGPGHHFAETNYVGGRPLFGLAAEEVELGSQPAFAAADVGVDALAVVVQGGCCRVVEGVEFGLGGAVEADDAAEAVDVEGGGAEEFGEAAVGDAAVELHLPEAVLCVGEALGAVKVGFVLGVDVGDAMLVAENLHFCVQFGKVQLAIVLGGGPLNQPPVDVDDEPATQQKDDEDKGDGQYHCYEIHGLPSVAYHLKSLRDGREEWTVQMKRFRWFGGPVRLFAAAGCGRPYSSTILTPVLKPSEIAARSRRPAVFVDDLTLATQQATT